MYTNLKIALWRSGIHQNRLAQALQLDEAILSRIVNGLREPTRDQRNKIAIYLNADEEWLFARDIEFLKKRSNPADGFGTE